MEDYYLVKGKGRIFYIEILRAISIIAVIIIHISASETLVSFTTTNIKYWWIQNIFDSLARWSVPVFVMISGALLLNPAKQEPIGMFLKKKGLKMLIPFFVWGLFYLILSASVNLDSLTVKYIIRGFIEGPMYYHMWFMYMIIALYAITPLLKNIILNSNQDKILYLLLIIFISVSLIDLIEKFTSLRVNNFFTIKPLGGFIGYFILGYYLHTFSFSKVAQKAIYFGAVVSALIIPIGTYYLTSKNNGQLDVYLYDYTNPFVLLISMAIFLAIKNVKWAPNPKNYGTKMILAVSSTSFGIYLVHPFVMYCLNRFNLHIFSEVFNPLIRVPLVTLIVLVISIVAVKVLKKIPYIKNIVP
ncbi:hypothetical protein EK386_02405 [Lysinibacillus antri]|uniref:Acyltransferase 3 domain-containing protein n=1 Tax=Lysinibacillus antri TaxID=2498145 RepID=A0A432LFS1_9BACI|nr:hypothetical protein EK386_02405 [Lysinibacillus antri]